MRKALFLLFLAIAPSSPLVGGAIARNGVSQDRLSERIISYMEGKNYKVFKKSGELNIVYLEGVNYDGSLNDNAGNQFNDRRIVIVFSGTTPKIVHNAIATTNPGVSALNNRPDIPHIQFGQYTVWKIDRHIGPMEAAAGGSGHEALVNDIPVPVIRTGSTVRPDANEIEKEKTYDGKPVMKSTAVGINQHWGHEAPIDDIRNASWGCLVSPRWEDHKKFMNLLESDPRYKNDSNFLFTTAIINGRELQ